VKASSIDHRRLMGADLFPKKKNQTKKIGLADCVFFYSSIFH
jgi:hypothetical protein